MSAITQIALILCFVAGKSGGHLLPCITKAEQMLKQNQIEQAYLFSAGSELDYKIMNQHSAVQHYVPSKLSSIPYKKPWMFPVFLYEITSYFFSSLYKLWSIKPAKILSFGGLNSIPVAIAGWILHIPLEIYELNVEPGKTIQFLSRFTDTVHICFAQTADYFKNKSCIVTPYPVRFTENHTIYDKEKLLTENNLQKKRKTVLILGGSQGSLFVNQAIKESIESDTTLQKSIQIIHQIGINEQGNYQAFYEKYQIPAVVFAYNEQLHNFYNLADVIICRAGAGTLFEVEFFKKPCIVIPLQTDLNDHQVQNAQAIAAMYPEQFSMLLQDDCQNNLAMLIKQKLSL
jgi:UDP-N-acetylglucosamine--N-acetylmuramyl-(pentapeptide) pyrophosphoryl-undecaprenol N-acetylglucosamine transferase